MRQPDRQYYQAEEKERSPIAEGSAEKPLPKFHPIFCRDAPERRLYALESD
jgi:hypothetical protein